MLSYRWNKAHGATSSISNKALEMPGTKLSALIGKKIVTAGIRVTSSRGQRNAPSFESYAGVDYGNS